MDDTKYYIERLRPYTKTRTDYAVSKLIGVSRAAMCKYKQGKSSFDSDTALKVGEVLGLNPLIIIANIKASKAKNWDSQQRWKSLAESISNISKLSSILTLAFILSFSYVPDSIALTKVDAIGARANAVYYVKLKIAYLILLSSPFKRIKTPQKFH